METIKLTVHEREETGDGPARRLRAKGLIPAISYAKNKPATPIAIGMDELKAAMAHGHNVILELDFEKGQKATKGATKGRDKAARYAVIKQLQFHPIKRQLLHVDLHEVDLAEEIEASVTIEPTGTPAGLADGGVLDWERREVTVRALPADIPPTLELDVSGLLIGHHLTVAAMSPPKGVVIVDDPDTLMVSLVPPRVEQPPAGAEGAEAAQAEVIGSTTGEE
jgi:large subunit ribosomal protein L25